MPPPLPHLTPIYRTAEIRHIETLAASLPGPPALMERAGLVAAQVARDMAADSGKPVLVVAGPGNNGGDAFVIARHLKQWWFDVSVVFAGTEEKLSYDARAAYRAWRDAGGTVSSVPPARAPSGLVVDGLFGIGLQREVIGVHATLVEAMNGTGAPVLAVDIPSGLDSDTGRVLGCAVRATQTVTFIALKPGLLTRDGPDHCGALHVASLGLDTPQMLEAHGNLSGAECIGLAWPPRRRNTHKGTYGSAGIVGGANGMVGAALLAGRTALKTGAGRVYVGLLADGALAVDALQPELMLRAAREVLELEHLDALAVGPGLSRSADALALLARALRSTKPLVLDADALNLVSDDAALKRAVLARTAPTIMTPHPAEAARLLGCSTEDVQRDRLAAAAKLATSCNAGVVLKGAGSVLAWPDGHWAVNPSGNPALATAGTGDVLTGCIAALLAQGCEATLALVAGVYLHGAAADALVTRGNGPIGLAAGELTDAARALINRR